MAKEIPSVFISSLKDVSGFDEEAFLQTHDSGDQLTSIRINPSKFNIEQFPFEIDQQIPWSSQGYYLTQRPSFTIDPLFHAGAYYVQEASSMFLEEAIRQCCDLSKPLRVLDLCAAPGGKSTLIQSIISNESLLVSNEVIKSRASILAENMSKWGAINSVVTNNDPAHFKRLPAFFDLIVVDAPCSGSGLFRKDPEAIHEWSLNNVQLCSQRQQRILADITESLKPGGILIYSTCSYSIEENEVIEDWFIENEPVSNIRLSIKKEWGIVETFSEKHQSAGYRFYPDKVRGEGFFIAAFIKHKDLVATKEIKNKTKPTELSKADEELIKKYILQPDKYRFVKWQEEVLVFPASMYESILILQSVLYIKKAGIKMGTIIRNEFIPHHEWAISSIRSDLLQKIETTHETVLDYLRRKEVSLNCDRKGWALISYKGMPMGLVKILPGRVNNYYPKEWRILNK